MTGIWSQRAVLRAGYGIVIGVLVLSAMEAYRIQVSVSQKHLGIYRHYVDQEEVLSTLRRNLWLAGNYVRDFFINVSPDRAEVLRAQMETLKKENQEALEYLARTPNGTAVVPNLRKSLDEFFAVVEQAKRELQQLSARLLEIEEEGRRKLSRELHDEIGQTLALLQIEISHAQALPNGQTAALRERLARARELAERTVQTIRNIS